MLFRQIHDRYLSQYAYLIGCQETKQAIVIDPQRDVDRYLAAAEAEGMRLVAAADTHIHADYLTGLRELAEDYGITAYVSGADEAWRYRWLDRSALDHRVLTDGDRFQLGTVDLEVVHTPGHTPEHLSFLIRDGSQDDGDAMGLLTGDFVFVGDVGRPDLLEPVENDADQLHASAAELFESLRRFREMPDWLQVWPAHGAGSACGKALSAVPHSTVGYELRHNESVRAAERGAKAFVAEILRGQPDPPLYFGRMKELNRDGPPLLESLPEPPAVAEPLATLADRMDVVVVDTRPREQFVAGHLPASLLAPFDASFCTTVGSYVPPGMPVYLIIDPSDLDEAVRCLVRIGLDDVAGYVSPHLLGSYLGSDAPRAATPMIDFSVVRRVYDAHDAAVIDVRSQSEYEEEHIPGAMNVPHTRLLERIDEIPSNRLLIVHCETGIRSAVASAVLQREGYQVQYVNDEFEAARAMLLSQPT